MTLLNLLLIGLATWRLTAFLCREDGPFNLFRKLRESTGITHDEDGMINSIPEKPLAKLFGCPWCMTVWMAIISYILFVVFPIGVYILAISTIAIIIGEKT